MNLHPQMLAVNATSDGRVVIFGILIIIVALITIKLKPW